MKDLINTIKKMVIRADFAIALVSLIGILVVVNYFSYDFFWREDLTKDGLYSITDVSKKTVSNLDDIVSIKVYFSDNLPSYYALLKRDLKDILSEYSVYSKNKIAVEFVDISKINNPEVELSKKGIPALMVDVIEKDKRQTVKAFMGISLQKGDRNEVIPVIKDGDNLEYQITLAIKKVLGNGRPKIAFVKGGGCASLDNDLGGVKQVLSELYDIYEVDLKKENISPDTKTLMIVRPENDFSEEELKKIDKFATGGGSIFLAVDGVNVGKDLAAQPNKTNVIKLTESYGLKINKDLLADVNMNSLVFFINSQISYPLRYPFFPVIVSDGFNKDYSAVAKLESLSLLWASSLDKSNSDVKVDFLAKTSEESVSEEGSYNIYPNQDLPDGKKGSKNVAAIVNGKLNSPYGNKGDGRVVVVSDGDFMTDNQLRLAPSNILFVQNMVDLLSYDGDLINIRSKNSSFKIAKNLGDTERMIYKYGNIFGLAISVLLFGLVRYYFRRRKAASRAVLS